MWKPVTGYEGYYEANCNGEIRSMDRFICNNGTKQKIYGRIKSPKNQSCGYLQVELYKDGIGKKQYIHRIIAELFVENPFDLSEVNHKDGNKKNNNCNNLEWVSRKNNYQHAVVNALINRDGNGRFIHTKTTPSQAKSTLLEGVETTGVVKST